MRERERERERVLHDAVREFIGSSSSSGYSKECLA